MTVVTAVLLTVMKIWRSQNCKPVMRATDVWEMFVAKVIRTQPQAGARFCFDVLRASGHSVLRYCICTTGVFALPNPPADSCNAPPSCVRDITGHGQGRVACWTRYGVQWRILKLMDTTYRSVAYTKTTRHSVPSSGVYWNCSTLIYRPVAYTETAGHDILYSGVYWNCCTLYTIQWRILKLLDTI